MSRSSDRPTDRSINRSANRLIDNQRHGSPVFRVWSCDVCKMGPSALRCYFQSTTSSKMAAAPPPPFPSSWLLLLNSSSTKAAFIRRPHFDEWGLIEDITVQKVVVPHVYEEARVPHHQTVTIKRKAPTEHIFCSTNTDLPAAPRHTLIPSIMPCSLLSSIGAFYSPDEIIWIGQLYQLYLLHVSL